MQAQFTSSLAKDYAAPPRHPPRTRACSRSGTTIFRNSCPLPRTDPGSQCADQVVRIHRLPCQIFLTKNSSAKFPGPGHGKPAAVEPKCQGRVRLRSLWKCRALSLKGQGLRRVGLPGSLFADVGCWHFAPLSKCLPNGRYWGEADMRMTGKCRE